MNTLKFTVLETYANKPSADRDAEKKGLKPDEAVFYCENGMFGYEIRIYDDWKEWQPNLYLESK